MKNSLPNTNRFRVIEKPNNLHDRAAKNTLYYDIIATLDVIANEKCVELSKDEIGVVSNFRSYLGSLAKKMGKKYTVCSSYDENKEIVYICKRDKIGKEN